MVKCANGNYGGTGDTGAYGDVDAAKSDVVIAEEGSSGIPIARQAVGRIGAVLLR